MNSNPPVDFEQKVRLPKGELSSDYPYAIKAADLMKNFVYATLDVDISLYDEVCGMGGHVQRRLNIPRVPGSGTYVLGAVDGAMQWLSTEEC